MSVKALGRSGRLMETKRISVSNKRQITIPQRFYEKLNISDEVECIMTSSEIIIRPVLHETEFAEDILKDLIAKGYEGEELLAEFKNTRAKIRPAVKRILEEAEKIAQSTSGNGDDVMKEIFSARED